MRLLQLSGDLAGGGAQRQLCYLACELARRGHEVHVGIFNSGPNRALLAQTSEVHVHVIGRGHDQILGRKTWRNYHPRLAWNLLSLIRRLQPDVIQTWTLQMDVLGGALARILGIPWVLREPLSALGYPTSWRWRLRNWIGRAASAIAANSETGSRYWSQTAPKTRRTVIRNGVPTEAIALAEPLQSGSAEAVPLVLFAGRFDAQKNVERTMQAFLQLASRVECQIVVCGAGPAKAQLTALLEAAGNPPQISLWNYQQDLWPLMKRANVFVSAAHFEGFPNTVLEAMACGVPVVVSDIPEHHEILTDDTAEFVDPSSTESIVTGILQVLRQPDRSKWRVANTQLLLNQFSVVRMATDYESLYADLQTDVVSASEWKVDTN